MNKIQSHRTSHASSISQFAAIEALTGPQYIIKEMMEEFRKRREFLHSELVNETSEKLFYSHSEQSEESLFITNVRYFTSFNMTIINYSEVF